jgi:hypothetical protein
LRGDLEDTVDLEDSIYQDNDSIYQDNAYLADTFNYCVAISIPVNL